MGAAPSQETAFLATLRWLDANEGADDAATHQLLSSLDYERLSSTPVLAAARGHARFRAWPGALTAVAAAALLRDVTARAGSAGIAASLCRRRLHGESLALGASASPAMLPPPLVLDLEIPLPWLAEQAAVLEQRTSRLQAQPASQQEIDSVQQQLAAVFPGTPRAYRGHSWVPSLALFLRINRPTATRLPPGAPAPPAPAAAAAAGEAPPVAQQRVSHKDLHLSASLQLEVMPLPPLAPASVLPAGSLAYTPGPLARVSFATGTAIGGISAEPRDGHLLLGAYGVHDVATPDAACVGLASWQPSCPPDGAACLVAVFQCRPLFAFGAPPAYKLPDLSMHLCGGKLRFQVTVALDD